MVLEYTKYSIYGLLIKFMLHIFIDQNVWSEAGVCPGRHDDK